MPKLRVTKIKGSTVRKNAFPAGSLPRTPLGELTLSQDRLVGWGGETPPHTSPSALAVVPLDFQPDLCLCL